VRIKTLERQEKYMRDRYQSLQDQLSKALGVEQKGQEDTG